MDTALHFFRLANSACGTHTGAFPSLFDGVPCTGADFQIKSVDVIIKIVGNAVRIAMAFAGGLAVILLLVGSVYFVISTGDPGRVKRAKDIIQNTVIGL